MCLQLPIFLSIFGQKLKHNFFVQHYWKRYKRLRIKFALNVKDFEVERIYGISKCSFIYNNLKILLHETTGSVVGCFGS